LIFIGGFISGILATIFVAFVISVANKTNDDGLRGLTIFPEKGECIATEYEKTDYGLNRRRLVTTVVNEIEVFQVLAPNMALARTHDFTVVLLINYDDISYYDNQKIQIPANKCARQIGTYQYTSKDERNRTVPAVVID
jgi:hypothetical protein